MANSDLFAAWADVLAATRDHCTLALQIAERRARERDRCESGCSAPVVVDEPAKLCAQCADEMDAWNY